MTAIGTQSPPRQVPLQRLARHLIPTYPVPNTSVFPTLGPSLESITPPFACSATPRLSSSLPILRENILHHQHWPSSISPHAPSAGKLGHGLSSPLTTSAPCAKCTSTAAMVQDNDAPNGLAAAHHHIAGSGSPQAQPDAHSSRSNKKSHAAAASRPQPHLPDRAVTSDTIEDAYVSFIFYCNPAVPLESADTESLREAFRNPPRSGGKSFDPFVIYQLVQRFYDKEIKTWTELTIKLGVEPPDPSKDESAQKIAQYGVRLKVCKLSVTKHDTRKTDLFHRNGCIPCTSSPSLNISWASRMSIGQIYRQIPTPSDRACATE